DVIRLLLAQGAQVDVNYEGVDGRTPLSCVAANGYHAIVELLFGNITQVTQGTLLSQSSDSYNRTPIHYAARNGHEAVAKLLLRCDVMDIFTAAEDGEKPFLTATRNGHENVASILLEALESRS
ncbi:ankyrin repeat-containing domain protein, partial [Kalaharituber pfeilii]